MLRYPPFTVQEGCVDEGEEDTVRASHDDAPGGTLQAHHRRNESLSRQSTVSR